jgi:hypothetical protein
MNTTTTFPRINDIIARQRSSRLRDVAFSILLALGVGLSAGALRTAVAHAGDAPAAVRTAPAAAPAPALDAAIEICDVEISC